MTERYVSETKAIEDLANAIVQKAVSDYKAAYTKYLKKPHDAWNKVRLDELRVFFRGQWFGALTTVDVEYLLEKIENECKEKHALKEALMGKRKETEWKLSK